MRWENEKSEFGVIFCAILFVVNVVYKKPSVSFKYVKNIKINREIHQIGT